jgi:hypothetical protein
MTKQEFIDKWGKSSAYGYGSATFDFSELLRKDLDELLFPSLPTDEEIEKEFPRHYNDKFHRKSTINSFNLLRQEGAKWLRDTYHPKVDWEKVREEFGRWIQHEGKTASWDNILHWFINYFKLN